MTRMRKENKVEKKQFFQAKEQKTDCVVPWCVEHLRVLYIPPKAILTTMTWLQCICWRGAYILINFIEQEKVGKEEVERK